MAEKRARCSLVCVSIYFTCHLDTGDCHKIKRFLRSLLGFDQSPNLGSNLTSSGRRLRFGLETMETWQSLGVCWSRMAECAQVLDLYEIQGQGFWSVDIPKRALDVILRRARNSKPSYCTDGEVQLWVNGVKAEDTEISQRSLTGKRRRRHRRFTGRFVLSQLGL